MDAAWVYVVLKFKKRENNGVESEAGLQVSKKIIIKHTEALR